MTIPTDLPILFGQVAIPARTQVRGGYLARPDLRGSHPTVVVAHSAGGLSSSLRETCRTLARHGLAVLAPDLYRGAGPGRGAPAGAVAGIGIRRAVADLGNAVAFARGTEWSHPGRVGVLGMGAGGPAAVLTAGERPEVRAVTLCYSPLVDDGGVLPEAIASLEAPLLGLYGREDEVVDVGQVAAARERQPAAQWVIYQDAGHDFLEDGSDSYDGAAAADAIERMVRFFVAELAPTPAGATG